MGFDQDLFSEKTINGHFGQKIGSDYRQKGNGQDQCQCHNPFLQTIKQNYIYCVSYDQIWLRFYLSFFKK